MQLLENIGRRCKRALRAYQNRQLMKRSSGIIHVGANEGQERDMYAAFRLPVIWIEPIPAVFKKLSANISVYPDQRAFNYLVGDRDETPMVLNISNNGGLSSSVLSLAEHRDIWPEVDFNEKLELTAYTLDTIIEREMVAIEQYDSLVLDTQGSELDVLHGAVRTLQHIKLIKTEVADFEAYAGCARPETIAPFLRDAGFYEKYREPFANHPRGGRYYDITYVRAGES